MQEQQANFLSLFSFCFPYQNPNNEASVRSDDQQKLTTIKIYAASKNNAKQPNANSHLNVITSNIHKTSNKNSIVVSPTL